MTNDRTRARQDRLRSNAAGPHGAPRSRSEERRLAIQEAADAAEHEAEFQAVYGTRFVCSCGEVSGYYTSLRAAGEAHDAHKAGDDHYGVTPGTTPSH